MRALGSIASSIALLGAALAAQAGPTFTVNSLGDAPGGGSLTNGVCETAAGNGICTLRAAIMEANHAPGGDARIVVPAGTYILSRAPANPDTESAGDLDLLAPMTIEGSASVIDGSAIDRVLDVSDVAVVLRGLVVRNGGTRPVYADNGGCIRNAGDLTLDDFATTAICNALLGGAIFNSGSLSIRRSVISGGSAVGVESGGGIHNAVGAVLTIEESLFQDNAAASGGGIGNLGEARIASTSFVSNDSTVLGASAGGGGIYNAGQLELLNVTVSENNAAQHGGGLFVVAGSAHVVHSTFAENRANTGGSAGPGSWGGGIARIGTSLVFLANSIVAQNWTGSGGNLAANECFGTITSGDHNVIGARLTCSFTGTTTHVNASDAPGMVVALASNGGFARSHRSNAGATIPLASCTDLLGAPLELDGRGHRRGGFGACEPGAVEEFALYTPDPAIGVELLRNGGAAGNEFGVAVTDRVSGGGHAPTPYWELPVGPLAQVFYGAPDFPTTADAPAGSGGRFFSGGATTSSSEVVQTIDVSGAAAEIDAGDLPYRISGAFGGHLADEDHANLFVRFLNGSGGSLGTRRIGDYTAADRGNVTVLLPAAHEGLVPVGTRTITATLVAVHEAGPYNDGFADDLSLVLPEPASALATLVAVATLALSFRRAACRAARGSA
jgi:CSLREA domain-containing protein